LPRTKPASGPQTTLAAGPAEPQRFDPHREASSAFLHPRPCSPGLDSASTPQERRRLRLYYDEERTSAEIGRLLGRARIPGLSSFGPRAAAHLRPGRGRKFFRNGSAQPKRFRAPTTRPERWPAIALCFECQRWRTCPSISINFCRRLQQFSGGRSRGKSATP